MNKKKELISYYDMGGEPAKMYKRLDDYLMLTAETDSKKIDITRKIGAASGIIMALIFIITAVYMRTLISSIVLGAFVVMSGLVTYKALTNDGQMPQAKRANGIMEKDGLETVYRDFMYAKPVPSASALIGARYLFIRDEGMVRVKDIKNFYLRTESNDEESEGGCFLSIRLKDEFGSAAYDIRRVSGNRNERKLILGQTEESIRKINTKLLKCEDDFSPIFELDIK